MTPTLKKGGASMANTEMNVVVTSARVDPADGRQAARMDLIEVGGGTQTKTVDGQPEHVVHPRSQVWHVRLFSPDRTIPDELREVDSWEDAVTLATAYAGKLAENAQRIAALAADLKV